HRLRHRPRYADGIRISGRRCRLPPTLGALDRRRLEWHASIPTPALLRDRPGGHGAEHLHSRRRAERVQSWVLAAATSSDPGIRGLTSVLRVLQMRARLSRTPCRGDEVTKAI